ncbi:unnamed protein product [Rotaria socialis]|nr:unnamed protein product [Rotaria socialis]CAF3543150.1 unnamed protein product [Rotaria socialis]CAF4471000.1 unnamed protein product [Rotaria socialis]CAF4509591.1 unnamed protein product [Rotaria socialis]
MNAIKQAIETGALTSSNDNETETLLEKVTAFNKICNWEDNIKGIYCGGDHKILVISGGPCIKGGKWDPEDIKIRESNANIIPANTKFRKSNGLFKADIEYWTSSDKKWYPSLHF